VAPDDIALVAGWAGERDRPFHVHLSEQQVENDECLAATGLTPTALLADAGALGPLTTAVHATHLDDAGINLLGRSATGVCLCPTTERDLGDGIGPAHRLAEAGAALSLGSDSQAAIDLLEEARAVEMNLRLAEQRRGIFAPQALAAALWQPATAGWPGGEIAPGRVADLTSVSLTSVRTAGTEGLGGLVFAASAADVTHVVVGGRLVVEDGHHLLVEDPARLIAGVCGQVWP
jgi:cytosine/adenosine deaminase-related metal-dependent hydrolase